MKSGINTTHIFLDRGTEDMQLLSELHKISSITGIKGTKEFIEKYPLIHELKYQLNQERED